MFSFANSRTCIIALLRSSLAAHQQLHQHQHSLQFQPRFAATASGFHASFRSYDARFATSICLAANLRSPPSPLTLPSRLRRRAASKNYAAIRNRFTASLGFAVSPRSGNQPSLRSKPALPRKSALRYLLDQRRLYSAEPARCTLPPRRSHASSPHPITNPTMTFTFNPTHDIHIYFSTPTMTLSLAGEP